MLEAQYLAQMGQDFVQAHKEDIEEFNNRHEQIAQLLEQAAAESADLDRQHQQKIQAIPSAGNHGPTSV